MVTLPSARDFLHGFGTDHYKAATLAVLGAEGELRYGGGPDRTTPANDKYWARIAAQVVDQRQETLRLETKRWVTTGLVYVQLFAPITDRRGQPRLDAIAELVKNAFWTHQNEEIEFTNAWINDNVAAEPQWIRANVISNFAYRQFI